MSGYRKLGRTSSQRKAMLRGLTTHLLYYGRIKTTVTRAKEIQPIAEKLITLAVKERDNYDNVTVTVKVPKKNAKGQRMKEEKNGEKVTIFDTIEKQIKKDRPSRLNARRKMLAFLYPITVAPKGEEMRKKHYEAIDMPKKLFEEIAPKYADRKGGYTRIIKVGMRKGDGAEEAIIELV